MQTAPHLLYIIGGLGIGGTERHLSQVLPSLRSRGWSMTVLRLGDDGPMAKPISQAGIEIVPMQVSAPAAIPRLGGLAALVTQARHCATFMKKRRPDLVHCFLGAPTIVGAAAHSLRRTGNLLVSKRNQLSRPDAFLAEGRLERWAMRSAQAVLAHSTAVRDELISIGIPAGRISLIHNGINVDLYRAAQARRTEIRGRQGWGQEVVFIMAANLIPYKGHTDFLAALRIFAKRIGSGASWRAVFVGSGEGGYAAALHRQTEDLGLSERVDFLGRREDIVDLLAAADVGALASHHEGFSNAVLEYMAAALPVVATAVGGNRDAVAKNETGLLVPPADEGQMADALGKLYASEHARRAMGQAGEARVLAEFSLDRCVDKYEAVYRSLLASPDNG